MFAMALTSVASTATAASDVATILMRVQSGGTINTDLAAYASRDGGTTWTQGTLAKIAEEGDHDYFEATVDLSGQPSGTSMKWKVETTDDAVSTVEAVAMAWG
jgi:hypothetical protein